MVLWRIEPLNQSHQRAEFHCGENALDDFFHCYVNQYEKKHLGRTYVALSAENSVLGFYTIATSSLEFQSLPPDLARKLPKHPVPVILLARLAVDKSARGMGLGAFLLQDALRRSLTLSDHLGVFAVSVEAKDKLAASFYNKFGFKEPVDRPEHMVLSIATIKKSVSSD